MLARGPERYNRAPEVLRSATVAATLQSLGQKAPTLGTYAVRIAPPQLTTSSCSSRLCSSRLLVVVLTHRACCFSLTSSIRQPASFTQRATLLSFNPNCRPLTSVCRFRIFSSLLLSFLSGLLIRPRFQLSAAITTRNAFQHPSSCLTYWSFLTIVVSDPLNFLRCWHSCSVCLHLLIPFYFSFFCPQSFGTRYAF